MKEFHATSNDTVSTDGRASSMDENLNAFWYMLLSGPTRRALPSEFGKWGTIY